MSEEKNKTNETNKVGFESNYDLFSLFISKEVKI